MPYISGQREVYSDGEEKFLAMLQIWQEIHCRIFLCNGFPFFLFLFGMQNDPETAIRRMSLPTKHPFH